MRNIIDTYLNKHACTEGRPLAGDSASAALSCVVVIPALAEYDCLFDTLFALSASSRSTLESTQVIVVVNNRAWPHASPADMANNARTLAALESCAAHHVFAPMHLSRVDASSPGCELPAKDGVGLARRIGADHALRLLAGVGCPDAPIVHLDADSPTSPGYLDTIIEFYSTSPRWGGYASYAHPVEEADTPEGRAIIAYEIYMRYHELALRHAGSPYAHPALGSIMSSTARAYASVGGMNHRCAGEDFYFMQQLAKTGTLETILGTAIYPSGRRSQRTPFGTGRVVSAGVTEHSPCATLYHPESYLLLRRWFAQVSSQIMSPGSIVFEAAAQHHPELGRFLAARDFTAVWDKIAANHSSPESRLRQFHVWFDGLRTIQLIHHLRDSAFPNVSASEALTTLFPWYGREFPENAEAVSLTLLRMLRRLCTAAGRRGS